MERKHSGEGGEEVEGETYRECMWIMQPLGGGANYKLWEPRESRKAWIDLGGRSAQTSTSWHVCISCLCSKLVLQVT